MSSFTGQAIEPGVYFKISDVQLPNVPAGAFLPILIGLGSKTLTIVESVLRETTGDLDSPLTKSPVIKIDSIIDISGKTHSGYTLDSNNKIDWSTATEKPPVGKEYFVTYTYEKEITDYDAKVFSSVRDVIAFYGPAKIATVKDGGTATGTQTVSTLQDTIKTWTVDAYKGMYVKITSGTGVGQIRVIQSNTTDTLTVSDWGTTPDATSVYQITDYSENSISLAAQILFENTAGNGFVYCVQAKEDTDTEFQAALDRIKDKENSYCLVVLKGLTSSDSLVSSIKTHVETQSATLGKYEKIALIGAPATTVAYTDFITYAGAVKSSRVAYIAPGYGKRSIDGVEYTFDGSYIATAVAGIITNPIFDAAEPIGGKNIVGFNGIPDNFLLSEKRLMLGDGVLVIENVGGVPKILQALSTDISTVINADLKITRIKDYIIKLLRNNLQEAYINTRNLGSVTLSSMKAFVKSLLDGAILQNILVAHENLEVTQDTLDPRQVNVSFKIKPVWSIEYIFVTFGVTFP